MYRSALITLAVVFLAIGCQPNQSSEQPTAHSAGAQQSEGADKSNPEGKQDPAQIGNEDGVTDKPGQESTSKSHTAGNEESAKKIEGLETIQSDFDMTTTVDNMKTMIGDKGLTLLATIDHQANANSVDMELPPTTLLIFGKPKAGTPLMQTVQTIGIDLPMKALVFQHANGNVYVSYNQPAYLAQRHGIRGKDELLEKMTTTLADIVEGATSRN